MNIRILHDMPVSPSYTRRASGQACAYPMTAEVDGGLILCAYRCGKTKHSYDGKLLVQISADKAETWSDPLVVYDGTGLDPPQSLVSFQALAASDGSLLAVFDTVIVTEPDSYLFSDQGRKQQRRSYKIHSYDGGQRWTDPENLVHFNADQHGIVGKSFVLPDGRIFINSGCRRPEGLHVITGSFSSDNGRTISAPIDTVWDPTGKLLYDDPYYTVFPDGQVVGLFWTHRRDTEETIAVRRCVSDDGGRVWTRPQPIGDLGQISVPLAVNEQTMVVASNFRQEPQGVRLWISHDRGLSFDSQRPFQMWDAQAKSLIAQPIDPEPKAVQNQGVWDALATFTFGTPDLLDLGDGTIVLTYYATIDAIIHIRACRFKLI